MWRVNEYTGEVKTAGLAKLDAWRRDHSGDGHAPCSAQEAHAACLRAWNIAPEPCTTGGEHGDAH